MTNVYEVTIDSGMPDLINRVDVFFSLPEAIEFVGHFSSHNMVDEITIQRRPALQMEMVRRFGEWAQEGPNEQMVTQVY